MKHLNQSLPELTLDIANSLKDITASVSIGLYEIDSKEVSKHVGAHERNGTWYVHTLNLNDVPTYEITSRGKQHNGTL